MNKVELVPTKLKFDQLPGQIKKAVPVIHCKNNKTLISEENTEPSESLGNPEACERAMPPESHENEPLPGGSEEGRPRAQQCEAAPASENPPPRERIKARSAEYGTSEYASTRAAQHSWPQVTGDISLRKVPRSRSGRAYVTEWRTNN